MRQVSQQSPRSGRERSQRQLRVGEVLRHALVNVLERDSIREPGLAGVSVTVTEVRVSPDLRKATAYIVPLGGANMDVVVDALRRAAPYLRRLLAGQVNFKRLPALDFEPDTSFDQAERIEALLDETAPGKDAATTGDRGIEGDGP